MNLNITMLAGRITGDPDLRHTNSNQPFVNFTLAVNKKYKTKSGESREEVLYIDCVCWGPRGEAIGKYLSKGDPILLTGELKLETWQDKDGNNRRKHKVNVLDFQFVPRASRDDGDQPRRQERPPEPTGADAGGYSESDIPF